MSGFGKMSGMGKKSSPKNTIGAAAKVSAPKIGTAAKSAGIKSVTSGMGGKAAR